MIRNLKSLAAIIFFPLISVSALSQWAQRQDVPGMSRTFATGFTVGNTIYVMCGYDGDATFFNDVWAYDPVTDAWTQKGDFPGGYRTASTAFTIGDKAYMGTGTDGNNYLNDFWEYDPLSDTWTQKADFPSFGREEAVSFSIGTKGYLGTGQTFVLGPNSSSTTTYNDFYAYDPTTDSWSQKDSLPGPSRAYAVAAAVGNKGYLGLGGNDDQTVSYTDFYEYDPVADQWTPKASMGGTGRADAGAFAGGSGIYVIGGINFPNFSGFGSSRRYDVLTDTWANAPNFGGGVLIAPVVQNVNGRVFAGTGYNGAILPRNDWWEFTSIISAGTTGPQPLFVFPNPFSDELLVNFGNDAPELRIELLDVQGRSVYYEPRKVAGYETRKIDTAHLSKGIYLLRITNNSGEVIAIKKIIKS